MSIRDSAKIALVNFKRHKIRTFLSVLGIVIGILSVSLIVSLGQGVKSFITSQVTMFGSDIIDVTTKVPGKGTVGTAVSMVQGVNITTLGEADFEAMEEFDFVQNHAGFFMGQVQAARGNEDKRVFVFATGSQYPNIDQQTKIDTGRYFNQNENKGLQRVAILGQQVQKELFGNDDPVGGSLKIGDHKFKVIGVTEERGQMAGFDYDDIVMMPLRTGQKLIFGVDHVMEGLVKVKEGTDMDLAVARIESLLRRRHKITDPDKDDFTVMSIEEALEIANTVTQAMSLLLIFLASISLIVGGVGIMNIMLVSLSERIREVGLRKAVGARDRDVMIQFLTESTILTALGGIIGIGLAFLFTFVGSLAARNMGVSWEISFPVFGFSIAFLVSVLVGLIFGLYPARKASQFDPIEAIREE